MIGVVNASRVAVPTGSVFARALTTAVSPALANALKGVSDTKKCLCEQVREATKLKPHEEAAGRAMEVLMERTGITPAQLLAQSAKSAREQAHVLDYRSERA